MGNVNPKEGTDYEANVLTSDKDGAATNAKVWLRLFNKNGNQSEEFLLDVKNNDDFKRGARDTFPLTGLDANDFGNVEHIEVRRGVMRDDWHVTNIMITNIVFGKIYIFPINRWIKADKTTKWRMYDSSLPQFSTEREQRRIELLDKKEAYEFEQKAPGIPAEVKNLPSVEQFSLAYSLFIGSTTVSLVSESLAISLTTKPWRKIKDIDDIFRFNFKESAFVDKWEEDVTFGHLAMNGCNPFMIRLCTTIPPNFNVNSKDVEPFLERETLQSALYAKRIFIIDHKLLEDIPNVPNPMCLYFVRNNGDLVPIAIQLYQKSSNDNPVFLPSDPRYVWINAKLWFQLADANFHEIASHLTFSHIILETIAIATHRNLSPSHPLFRLVAPHLVNVMAINSFAHDTLLNKGGVLDTSFILGHDATFALIAKSFDAWSFSKNAILPIDLQLRGLGNPNVLPNYHLRTDGLLIWESMKKFVSTIVNHYYDSGDKISDDHELQSFRATLSRPIENDGCGLKEVPGHGDKICHVDEIVDIFTGIIFMASAGHAAVNFGQYDQYSYPLNYPTKLIGQPPKNKQDVTEDDIVKTLQNKNDHLQVLQVIKLLSIKATNSLADYNMQYLYDPISVEALRSFNKDLDNITKKIEQRNEGLAFKYVHLLPENIPNDIGI